MSTESHTDADLRAAILALHADGEARTQKEIYAVLRGQGVRFVDYRAEELIRRLRHEKRIPGMVKSVAARSPAVKPKGEPVPWWRVWKREHLRRERSIQEWARNISRNIRMTASSEP